MLSLNDLNEVKTFFKNFNPSPTIDFDPFQHDEQESYILIDGGWLSIGKINNQFTVHTPDGDIDSTHNNLTHATRRTMELFARELHRREDDRQATEALAKEYIRDLQRQYA